MKSLISIIIPAYNAGVSISRCIDSIINQTYNNLEIIIINDGSDDNTAEVCMKYVEIDKRIKYIEQNNLGVSEARNRGIEESTGEYITFIDADDYFDLNFCSKMIDCIKKEQSDICICMNYNVLEYMGNDGVVETKIIKPRLKSKGITTIKSENYDFYDSYSHWTVWGVLYKRNSLKNIAFRKGLYVGEDTLFLSEIIKSNEKITFLDDLLFYYIIANESASHGIYNEKKLTELESWEKIIDLYSDRKNQQSNIKAAYCLRCIKILKNYFYKDKNFSKDDYKNVILKYRKNVKFILRRNLSDKRFFSFIKHVAVYIFPRLSFKIFQLFEY